MLGIFDSGIGGLTVLRALLEKEPSLPFLYLGDTARAPYGDKSPEVICRYAEEDVRFLLSKGATEILIACNTISALAISHLQATFPQIPIWNVIDPVIDAIGGRYLQVGVIGTRATVTSDVYRQRLHAKYPKTVVRSLACPLFVPLIEEGWGSRSETKRIVKRTLSPFRERAVEALILGCTHYPLIKELIQHAISKKTVILDAPLIVAEAYLQAKKSTQLLSNLQQTVFFTDLSPRTQRLAERWLMPFLPSIERTEGSC